MSDRLFSDCCYGTPLQHGSQEPCPVDSPKDYHGWSVEWDYGFYTATSPDYDASWEGPEDGWVDNGLRVSARTLTELRIEVDALVEERGHVS